MLMKKKIYVLKTTDFSRTQILCHVIYISFGSSLGKIITVPSVIIFGYVRQILGRDDLEKASKGSSWIGLRCEEMIFYLTTQCFVTSLMIFF